MSDRRRSRTEEIADEAEGRISEAAGFLTGDRTLEAEGRADQQKSHRKTYSVRPQSGGKWRVEAEGASRASSVHEMKDDAVHKAKELAQGQEPSQVLVYKKDGTIQTEQTYG
ncbi:MAG: DUF2188 domain-containing protein [Rubrobacteraceae bacterium]